MRPSSQLAHGGGLIWVLYPPSAFGWLRIIDAIDTSFVHDQLPSAALAGVGYDRQRLHQPDDAAVLLRHLRYVPEGHLRLVQAHA
eukprot:3868542-Pleurochrysis_carterae.AAC.1